jgi:catechol 2,3-dioxygenase-like lactoylglutathione lyase family enzyme
MQKLQSQGVHHITLTGANRQTSIDFWEGVLGMPFVFEQPNLERHPKAIFISILATEGSSPFSPTRNASPIRAGCRRSPAACIT